MNEPVEVLSRSDRSLRRLFLISALLVLVLMALIGPQATLHRRLWMVVQWVLIATTAVLAVLRMRFAWRWLSAALAFVAFAPGWMGGNMGILVSFPMALALIAFDFGKRAMAVIVVVLTALTIGGNLWMVLTTRWPRKASDGHLETLRDMLLGSLIFPAVLLVLGWLLATVVLELNSLRRENEALAAERARTNAELSAANAQLLDRLDTERELVLAEERARASRDMHDGLGHSLTLLGLTLDHGLALAPRDADAGWQKVREAWTMSSDALTEMRTWVRALNPATSSRGVTGRAALDLIAESFRGTGLDVQIATRGTERPLPDDVSLFLARTTQEGLTNALRHGHPTRVAIVLDFVLAHDVTLTMTDNGAGPSEPGREGFGLRSLRERAEALGGTATGRAAVGESGDVCGFELVARVPTGRVPAHETGVGR